MARLNMRMSGTSVSARSMVESLVFSSISVCTRVEGFFLSLIKIHCNLFTNSFSLLMNPEWMKKRARIMMWNSIPVWGLTYATVISARVMRPR